MRLCKNLLLFLKMLCRPMSSLGSGRVSGSLQGRFFIFCGVTNTINTLSQCIVYMYQHCIKHIKHTNKHTNFCGVTNTINSLSRCICAPSLHKKASEHTSQKRSHWRRKFTNRGCFRLARPFLLQMFEEAKPTQVYVWIWEKVASAFILSPSKAEHNQYDQTKLDGLE